MGSFKALTLSLVLAGGFMTGAMAADMPPPPALAPAPALPAASGPDMSGWYLRGDIGLSVSATPHYNADFIDNSVAPTGYNAAGFSNAALGDQMHLGFGAGYAFNSWFRSDVTFEYRGKANMSGLSTRYYIPCTGATPCTPGNQHMTSDQWQGHLSSTVALWNAYADLGTWSGITPYLGAGVGVANNNLSGVVYNGVDSDIVAGTTTISHNAFANQSKTNFAWALMAGLSYDVSPNAKLELGYRYMSLGKAQTGLGNCVSVTCGTTNVEGPVKLSRIAAQDFRIGMRWMLNAPPAAEPLVRKY